MASKKRARVATSKASESVVSRLVAKFLRMPPVDELDPLICHFVDNIPADEPLRDLLSPVVGVYAWTAAVAADVMNPRTQPLVEHLISHPGSVYVVKDIEHSAQDSIWLAVADPDSTWLEATRRMPCRGLTQTFAVGEADFAQVITIQLSSCRN